MFTTSSQIVLLLLSAYISCVFSSMPKHTIQSYLKMSAGVSTRNETIKAELTLLLKDTLVLWSCYFKHNLILTFIIVSYSTVDSNEALVHNLMSVHIPWSPVWTNAHATLYLQFAPCSTRVNGTTALGTIIQGWTFWNDSTILLLHSSRTLSVTF